MRSRRALGQRQHQPGGEAPDEAAGVGDVVDACIKKPEDEQDQRPLSVLAQDHRAEGAAALLAEGHHRAEQAEDRARGADREGQAEAGSRPGSRRRPPP